MLDQAHPRHAPRVQITLACALRRRTGSPIAARTVEIGPDGMRVASPRPLATDETVDFELANLDIRIAGHARVLRQQRRDVYALRFERLPEPMARRLRALAIDAWPAGEPAPRPREQPAAAREPGSPSSQPPAPPRRRVLASP